MRGKTHPPYSADYRRRIVDLYRNGRTPEQLARLRRENRRLREEREILKKAAAWFARENDPVDGSSGSSR